MRSLLLAGVSGALLVVGFPPYGWAWLTVVCAMGFLVAIRLAGSGLVAITAGVVFGLSFFGLLFPWIAELGAVAFVPLVLIETVFVAGYAGIVWGGRDRSPLAWTILVVGGWALAEWTRARVPFGGFAWGELGLPAGEYAFLRPSVAWIGVSGWTVILMTFAALGVRVFIERRPVAIARLSAMLVLVLAMTIAAAAVESPTDGQPVRVAIVQGSWPCPGDHCVDERIRTLESHLALTRSIEPGSVDLVVWAESSLGFGTDPIDEPGVSDILATEAARLGATILVGTDRPVGDEAFINANVVYGPGGELVGEYRKTHPVPFGEYVPLRPFFDWIPALSQVPRDMIRGDGPVAFNTNFGPFGSVISFESSFARYPRQTILAGARLLVVATSQNSYPLSRASDQLIGMTRMHSAALGVDVVHAAITGRSAIIVDGGLVQAISPLVEPVILRGTVQMASDDHLTLSARLGDWVAWLAMAGFLAVWLIPIWNHRVRRPPRIHPKAQRDVS